MTKQISLKTVKKLNMQGFKDLWLTQQDEPLKGGDAIDADHVDTAKRLLTVRTGESSEATVVTETVLEKRNRKERCLSEPVMVPGPEPQPITDYRNKSRVGHSEKEKRKTGLRKYSCELTVDTNTVHRNLKLSDHNRKVTCVREKQPYPDHPDRFDVYLQLLCSTGLTGRCYWEVEWRGWVEISISYRRTSRRGTGDDCRFGFTAQSWTLECSQYVAGYSVQHNNRRTNISSSVSGRAAVYVDCPAGTLSFYEVSSDKRIHLHTFHTTFTGPVFPGFGLLSPGSLVSLNVEQEQESHAIVPVYV